MIDSNRTMKPISSRYESSFSKPRCPIVTALRTNYYSFRELCSLLFVSIIFIISITSIEANDDRPNRVLELTSDNYDSNTGKYQIVVLNFYADWCPFSSRWKPVFQETAKSIYNETMDSSPYTIVFGQINCEVQTTLSQRFRITKFPTTKLTLGGKVCKKEYRGARTLPAFKGYIQKYLADPVVYVHTLDDIKAKVDEKKGSVIMYSGRFDEHGDQPAVSDELSTFRRIALQLQEDCQFVYVTSGASAGKVTPPDLYSIHFKPHHMNLDNTIQYPASNSLTNSEQLSAWAKENCIPLVREITFENAEEMTEEGLPFVILFYDPKDKTWIEVYKKVIEKELQVEAKGVTFLYADGHVFSHPLKHMGKTTKDLPLLAIDSFKHLFSYNHPIATISQPGYIKQFIDDLHSGKLDREFHFGPDPVSHDAQTSPPESAFNKLAPSAYRYSLLMPRDEL